MTEITYEQSQPVDGYGPGFFRIGGQVLRGATLATPTGAGAWGGLDDVAALSALAGDIDVVLIGTGAEAAHLPRTLVDTLESAGIGVEGMPSPSACRTYNVLLAEGRRVALAVLPV